MFRFLLVSALALSSLSAFAAERPNILLIVAEDMSPRVGAFGDKVANTPNIDALAAQGTKYTQVFTAAGVCAPSRSALITGVQPVKLLTHQMRTGSGGPISYEAVPPEQVKAFPELLRRAGYATANVAKKDYQFGEPFTIWDQDVGNFMADPDTAVWRLLPKDKPFFAMINLMATHESRLATEEVANDPDLPKRWGPMVKAIVQWRKDKGVEAITDPTAVQVPVFLPDNAKVRQTIAQFYDNIHYMDKQVGEILENLKADGLDGNTVVIWTTDHGDAFPRSKRAVYDSGLHVPMVIRLPSGKNQGGSSDRLVSFVDLAPTILGLAGVDKPSFVDGVDIFNEPATPYVFAARDRMDSVPDRVRAVRDERYKYMRNMMADLPYFRPLMFRDMFPAARALWSGLANESLTEQQAIYFKAPRPAEELYDTNNDPQETINLAANPEYANVLQRMRGAADMWLSEVPDWGVENELEMIHSIWPNGIQPITMAPSVITKEDGKIELTSQTYNASIGYRINEGDWQLYVTPFNIVTGDKVEAKAIRYGYKESAVTVL